MGGTTRKFCGTIGAGSGGEVEWNKVKEGSRGVGDKANRDVRYGRNKVSDDSSLIAGSRIGACK